jgi:hypothetical protein
MAKVHSLSKGIKAENQKGTSLPENRYIQGQDENHHYPVQDKREVLFIGMKKSIGMKGCKGRSAKYPVLESGTRIYKGHQQGSEQVKQQQAPAFSYLDKHFQDITLDKKTTDQERNNQQNHPPPCPDILQKCRIAEA